VRGREGALLQSINGGNSSVYSTRHLYTFINIRRERLKKNEPLHYLNSRVPGLFIHTQTHTPWQ